MEIAMLIVSILSFLAMCLIGWQTIRVGNNLLSVKATVKMELRLILKDIVDENDKTKLSAMWSDLDRFIEIKKSLIPQYLLNALGDLLHSRNGLAGINSDKAWKIASDILDNFDNKKFWKPQKSKKSKERYKSTMG